MKKDPVEKDTRKDPVEKVDIDDLLNIWYKFRQEAEEEFKEKTGFHMPIEKMIKRFLLFNFKDQPYGEMEDLIDSILQSSNSIIIWLLALIARCAS